MKIKELLENNEFDISTDSGKLSWLYHNVLRYGGPIYDWDIKDGKVFGKGNVRLVTGVTEIPFPIESLHGDFHVQNNNITSFKNFPKHIFGKLEVSYCDKLEDWTGIPDCNYLEINDCEKLTNLPTQVLQHLSNAVEEVWVGSRFIESLVGFDKVTEEIGKLTIKCSDVKEGGLGILLVKGLETLITGFGSPGWSTAQHIIRNYVNNDRAQDLYDCQTELIDANLERFTKL